MTRPAFQFYPEKWQTDKRLRTCSIGARGLWVELCCVMHTCEPYGHLTDHNRKPVPDADAAQLCGVDLKPYQKLLAELEAKGVPSRTTDGTLYSRRMVRDEKLRMTRADAGKQGGNPNLLNQNPGPKDNQGGNQNGGSEVNQNPGGKVKQIPTSAAPRAAFASAVAVDVNASFASVKHAVKRTPHIIPRAGDSHGTNKKTGQVNGKKPREKWGSKAWVYASATTFNMESRKGEEYPAFKDRVTHEANARRVKAASEARRRDH